MDIPLPVIGAGPYATTLIVAGLRLGA